MVPPINYYGFILTSEDSEIMHSIGNFQSKINNERNENVDLDLMSGLSTEEELNQTFFLNNKNSEYKQELIEDLFDETTSLVDDTHDLELDYNFECLYSSSKSKGLLQTEF